MGEVHDPVPGRRRPVPAFRPARGGPIHSWPHGPAGTESHSPKVTPASRCVAAHTFVALVFSSRWPFRLQGVTNAIDVDGSSVSEPSRADQASKHRGRAGRGLHFRFRPLVCATPP